MGLLRSGFLGSTEIVRAIFVGDRSPSAPLIVCGDL